jgi:O-antigen ligase
VPEYFTVGASYLRPYGSFPHPGWLAFFLALALMVLPATQWPRRRQFAVGAVVLLMLVLTFSRGSWVFVFIAALFYGCLVRTLRILVGTTAAAVIAFCVPAIRERFLGELVSGNQAGSYLSRSQLRGYALELWRDAPVIGHGSGSFFGTFSERRFPGKIEAHSDVLKLMADQGLVGLGLYLLVVGLCVFALVRARRREYMALTAVLITMPLMGAVDVYYRMNTGQVMLWALVGSAVVAVTRRSGRRGTGEVGAASPSAAEAQRALV